MRQIKKSPEPGHFIKWKKDFKFSNGRDAEYEDLNGTNEYLLLKKSLVEEQGYICCYCEKRIGKQQYLTDCDIDHFRPRHPDSRVLSPKERKRCIDAQMDYANLFASCKGEIGESADHCNHKKDNWFSFRSCISPSDPRIGGVFGFGLDGRLFVKDPAGQEMARHLNLNSYVLQEQRKAAFDAMMEVEFEDEDLLGDREYVEAVIGDYESMEGGEYTEFCSMIVYCLRENWGGGVSWCNLAKEAN